LESFHASQTLELHRLSQSAFRQRSQAAAALPDPDAANSAVAAANAVAAFQASQAREAHRVSQAQSRSQLQAAVAARPRATGAQLDALLDVDVFTPEDLDCIFANYEKNASAALAFFSANTQVVFGMRRDVSMDAQLWDVLGDPTDPNSAANGVTSETKAACIERCMKTLAQRELRACVACGVSRRPF
jgi:hypothetical protein